MERRAKKGSNFSIIAVAEGAINCEEAGMKRKEWMAKRAEAGFGTTATNRIAQAVQKKTGMETRVCIPGHMQRGGSPSAYDRVLATQFGSYAAKLYPDNQQVRPVLRSARRRNAYHYRLGSPSGDRDRFRRSCLR